MRSRPLTQRVQGRERPQLSDQLGVSSHGEVDVESPFHRHQPQLIQPGGLCSCEGCVGELDQRRTAPQAQRLVQDLARRAWPVRGDAGCVGQQPLEPTCVDLLGLDRKQIAGRPGDQHVASGGACRVLQRMTQPGHAGPQALHRCGRRPVAPQHVDQPVGGDHRPGMDQQHRKEPSLQRAADGKGVTVVLHAERSEDPEQGHQAKVSQRQGRR